MSLILAERNRTGFQRGNFVLIEKGLSPGAVDKFFGLLGKSTKELHAWLSSTPHVGMRVFDQKILPTPLLEFPLLLEKDTYHIFFIPLLIRALESIVYRRLRTKDPSSFGIHFGRIFESYLERCLSDAGVRFWNEMALKRVLRRDQKCVDFLIVEDDCNILIDAKGVEMSVRGRVSSSAEIVAGAVKDSAMKAIEQAQSTMRELCSLTDAASIPKGTKAAFLLVVTMEPLYLGPCSEFEATFGDFVRPKLSKEYGNDLPIPLDHVFFLSAGEFERLLARVRFKRCGIVKALRFARDRDPHAVTRRMDFGQHLEDLCSEERNLPLISNALEHIAHRCAARAR